MRVTFTKTGDHRYGVSVERESASNLKMHPAPGYDDWLPHDMVHFLVERGREREFFRAADRLRVAVVRTQIPTPQLTRRGGRLLSVGHLQTVGDVFELDDSCCDTHHEIEGSVMPESGLTRVQIQEERSRQPGQAIVPVDQGVVSSKGLQQRRRLQREGGISILPEGRGRWPSRRRVEQADVANRTSLQSSDQNQEVLQVEIFDLVHTLPRRSSTSPHLSIIRLELSSTRATWPFRS